MTSNLVGYSKSTRLQKNFISIKEHILNKEIKKVLKKIAPEFITLIPSLSNNYISQLHSELFSFNVNLRELKENFGVSLEK